jgi:phage FluMu protein Com
MNLKLRFNVLIRKNMSDEIFKYIWRCVRCSYHFANISKSEGMIKEEKKCPKCKSLNILTLTDKDLFIECKLSSSESNGYYNGIEESYRFSINP